MTELRCTTLLNQFRRRFGKAEAFYSNCSRPGKSSAPIVLLLDRTPPKIRLYSLLTFYGTLQSFPADVNEGREEQLPIQQHLTLTTTSLPTPSPTSQLTSSSPSTRSKRQLFTHCNLSQLEKQNNLPLPSLIPHSPSQFLTLLCIHLLRDISLSS